MRKSMLKLSVALAVVLVTAAFARYSADPSAVVVQIAGSVQVQKVGNATPVAASVGLALSTGDKVIVANGSKAVLLYKTGRMLTTTQSVTIEDAKADKPGGLFNQTVSTLTQVATTNARTQPNRQGMIRPIQGEPAPIMPRNGLKVASLQPVFRWFSLPDATGYIVQIRRIEPMPGKPERFTVASTDTTWTYPSAGTPLMPGALYEWTVASSTGRPATVQRFRVMGSDDLARVHATMTELISAGIDPNDDGMFLSALAFRDAGLMYTANTMLDRLAASGASGRAFYLLRGEVYDALGNVDGAAAAFSKADAEPNI